MKTQATGPAVPDLHSGEMAIGIQRHSAQLICRCVPAVDLDARHPARGSGHRPSPSLAPQGAPCCSFGTSCSAAVLSSCSTSIDCDDQLAVGPPFAPASPCLADLAH